MDRRGFLAAVLGVASVPLLPTGAWAVGARRSIPRPTGALTSSWDRDPWSRGAYSALPPGTSPTVRTLLAESLLGGRIALAGEYTSDIAPATTTGGERSGRTAAALLVDEVHPDSVIIVGAGIAGAAAAHALAAAGVEVTVLEARDRVGGRIHADTSWGVPVELGAAWIHGTTRNPITALAARSGLRLVPTDYEDARVRDTMTGRISSAGEEAQARVAAWVGQIEDGGVPASRSVGAALRRRGWRPDRVGAWAAEVEITQEYGLGPNRLGVRAMQEGDGPQGADALIAGNYSGIVSTLLEGVDVRLSSPVTAVRATSGAVSVTLGDGLTRSADAVVIAVPVALLQQQVIAIDPMPARVAAAIAGLRTGDLEKVILRYDREWWDDVMVFGVIGGGAVGAPAGSLAALRWTEFYPLTELLGFPALVGFAGGAAAMARPRTTRDIAAEAVAALDAAFTPR